MSLDNQLCGAGMSLGLFWPLRRVGLPKRRAAVLDSSTCERFFEAPAIGADNKRIWPVWHATLDQGSVGWPAMQYLVYGLGARVAVEWGRIHRITKDWKDAVKEARLMLVKLRFSTVLHLRASLAQRCLPPGAHQRGQGTDLAL